MKKWIIFLILLFAIISFTGYKFIKIIHDIETPDLEQNTVYSQNYTEDLFNNSLIGKTKNEIIKKLGTPLKIESFKPYLKFLYRDKNDNIFIDCNGSIDLSNFDIINRKYNFLSLEFDEKNNVEKVHNVKNSETLNSDSLLGISKNDIIQKYGNPTQIAQINLEGSVLCFSNIKNGSYTGKHPMIHIRNIIFSQDNIAVKIIKTDGNPYNISNGLCEIIDN